MLRCPPNGAERLHPSVVWFPLAAVFLPLALPLAVLVAAIGAAVGTAEKDLATAGFDVAAERATAVPRIAALESARSR
jgi:hypothetical protein